MGAAETTAPIPTEGDKQGSEDPTRRLAFGTAPGVEPAGWTLTQAGWGVTAGQQPAPGQAPPGQPPAQHALGQVPPGQPVFGQQPFQGYGYQQPLSGAAPAGPTFRPPGAPAPAGMFPANWGNRTGLILIIVGVALLLVLAVGAALYAMGRDSGYEIGACVKKGSNDSVLEADCDEKGAYRIVKKVDREDQCGKPDEPTITLESRGKKEVVCLEKAAKG
ncbi:MAG TPA: hypothetical protein VFZ32_11820 [Micromonosporaceae bacterium]